MNNNKTSCNVKEDDVYDLVIVGAGLQAFTLILSLLESRPEHSYSSQDEERHFYWSQKYQPSANKSNKPHSRLRERILVLDPNGEWNVHWHAQFETFGISHLRSPIAVHPDPYDGEGFRSFATQTGQFEQQTKAPLANQYDQWTKMKDQSHCCPSSSKKKMKKHKRRQRLFGENDRQKYHLPSQKLFQEFCDHLIKLYDLKEMVQAKSVIDICPILAQNQAQKVESFLLQLSDSSLVRTKKICMAIGPGTVPVRPSWATIAPVDPVAHSPCPAATLERNPDVDHSYETPTHQDINPTPKSPTPHVSLPCKSRQILHSSELSKRVQLEGFATTAKEIFYQKKLMVIGGGLTALHLCKQALACGATHVTWLTRKELRVQPYDLPLSWMSPMYRVQEQAAFFALENHTQRAEYMRSLRPGGSVTQEALAELYRYVSSERFEHLVHAEIEQVVEGQEKQLQVDYVCHLNSQEPTRHRRSDVDGVILGTGMSRDVEHQPLFQQLYARIPWTPKPVDGFPQLDLDLKWAEDCPVFVMGHFGALQLGPAAGTMAGAKVAVSRLAYQLIEELRVHPRSSSSSAAHRVSELVHTFSKRTNLYQALLA